jgi:integrase/recombinase XerD
MVLDTHRRVADSIELHDSAAKMGGGRTIPLHPDLRRALQQLRRGTGIEGAVIRSERGGSRGMRPGSIVNWFRHLYGELGFNGCSSHSGRRTFVTNAARLVFKAGGSLRDVQQLAGHRSIEQTQSYIDASAQAKRRLIGLM